jgi:hypothetical protein
LFGGSPGADEQAPNTEDLFGGEPATEAPMEEAPATEEAAADDLFGAEPAEDAPPTEAPATEAPATETPAADDLFGPSDDSETPATDDADDLFGPSSVLEQPGGFDSLSLRHWVDSTGSYTVDARLVAVGEGNVRLLKANGRTTTVPFSRLSNEDLEFVNAQASARSAQDMTRTAQR